MNLANLIKEIGRGAKGARSLSADEAEMLFTAMLDGAVPDLELGAILIALRVKGESDEELIGFCRAMQCATHTLQIANSSPIVILPTYNGVRRQPNLLPLLAQLLRDAGLKVLIHGRHDFDNRENPFPLFNALGIPLSESIAQAEEQLDAIGIALLDIEQLNPGLNALLNLRSRLGVRNTAHTLCKLLDPCPGQSIRVVNVTHPEYLVRMTTLLTTQQAHAMLLRGTEGEAFANPRRRPELMGFKNGCAEILFPAEEGGSPPIAGWPENADFDTNQQLIYQLLAEPNRIPQPILDQVLALKAIR
jgi:anthranilate phosphoribosyltransferase